MVLGGGHVWFILGVCGFLGGCAWFFGGVCMVFWGAYMVFGGVACMAFSREVCIGYDEIRSMSGRYASYWNAFLFVCKFTRETYVPKNQLQWVPLTTNNFIHTNCNRTFPLADNDFDTNKFARHSRVLL